MMDWTPSSFIAAAGDNEDREGEGEGSGGEGRGGDGEEGSACVGAGEESSGSLRNDSPTWYDQNKKLPMLPDALKGP